MVIADLSVLPWRPMLATFLVAQGLALVVLASVSLARIDRARNGPAFRALGTALGVAPQGRRLLGRASRRAGLASAAACLVSRGCFEHVVHKARLTHAERSTLYAIGHSVFGHLETPRRGYPVR